MAPRRKLVRPKNQNQPRARSLSRKRSLRERNRASQRLRWRSLPSGRGLWWQRRGPVLPRSWLIRECCRHGPRLLCSLSWHDSSKRKTRKRRRIRTSETRRSKLRKSTRSTSVTTGKKRISNRSTNASGSRAGRKERRGLVQQKATSALKGLRMATTARLASSMEVHLATTHSSRN